jgi:hypothetical protein
LNIHLIILFVHHRKTNVKYTNVPTRPSSGDEDDLEMCTVVPGAIVMDRDGDIHDEKPGVPRPAAFSYDVFSTTALAVPLEAVEVRSECDDEYARIALALRRLDALLRAGIISNEEYRKARQDAIGSYSCR